MVERNPDIARLQASYLFVEIAQRKKKLLNDNPEANLINLGIGDTTEPIPHEISEAFAAKGIALGTREGYSGYGDAFGDPELRSAIADKLYTCRIRSDDIFISDGAKCDLGRLQHLFGRNCTATIQDPSYPAYVAASVISGKTKEYEAESGQYSGIVYTPCTPKNGFLPDIKAMPHSDLIYICSPNNPTGTVLTHEQLKELVDIARERGSIIIFDSAYAGFIKDPSLPRSIYEIDGAEEVAIEISSFSKLSGFTGIRLGWSIVPKELRFNDGTPVQEDWKKIVSTFFNGPSNIAVAGGIAALTDEGLQQSKVLCDYYLENAAILRDAVSSRGYSCYGGDNAPYIWVDIKGRKSWELFDEILHKAHLVTTPGVGFGPAGEGFLRLSAFGERGNIIEAAKRLTGAL